MREIFPYFELYAQIGENFVHIKKYWSNLRTKAIQGLRK